MEDSNSNLNGEDMKQITDKIKQQFLNEKAELTMEWYQLDRRIKEVKKRVGEIDIIVQTSNVIEAEYEKTTKISDTD